jgi:hypothetical protein
MGAPHISPARLPILESTPLRNPFLQYSRDKIACGYRAVIPFEHGAREIVAWYGEDPARQRIDARVDAVMDKLTETYRPH